MLRARRALSLDDLDIASEDFMAEDVAHAPKRLRGFRVVEPYDARLTRREAVAILTRLGWSAEKIAAALGVTGRLIRRIRAENREVGDEFADD
jgi:hypothetical protein